MKIHKYLVLTVGVVVCVTSASLTIDAHAVADHWNKTHWVTMTKDVNVIKMKNTIPLANSYPVAYYTAKRGSHYKLDHWGTNYSWVFQSGKFNTNNKYTYTVDKRWNDTKWFKMEIHKIANYKKFHGYRIEARKSLYTHNTFYDKQDHATLSDYRPTQKSKVIFEYGSHVYPTSHEWDWMHGSWMTGYKYKNGNWKQISNDKIPD
ncbi:hypothetical protein [Levilactobacillus brevis]|uniref:hypothetical protein n=1 Tax=Levilactobacillus brevis TaxID=1580 RepID=UPI0035A3CC24